VYLGLDEPETGHVVLDPDAETGLPVLHHSTTTYQIHTTQNYYHVSSQAKAIR